MRLDVDRCSGCGSLGICRRHQILLGAFVMLRAIAITLVLCVLAGAWLHTQQNAVDARQALAESWGSPSAYFAAVGFRGDNLTVFLPDSDALECDVSLDTVLADKSIVKSLREEGFREISCGQRKSGL
jgi:hypothetical protein